VRAGISWSLPVVTSGARSRPGGGARRGHAREHAQDATETAADLILRSAPASLPWARRA
jgi:hypothetical protein